MPQDRPDANERFGALLASASRLRQLGHELDQAREGHAQVLASFLAAAKGDSTSWMFEITEGGQVTAEGPLGPEAWQIFHSLVSALSRVGPGQLGPGGGAGCPDKTGCANTGQLGNKCYYICSTVSHKS